MCQYLLPRVSGKVKFRLLTLLYSSSSMGELAIMTEVCSIILEGVKCRSFLAAKRIWALTTEVCPITLERDNRLESGVIALSRAAHIESALTAEVCVMTSPMLGKVKNLTCYRFFFTETQIMRSTINSHLPKLISAD